MSETEIVTRVDDPEDFPTLADLRAEMGVTAPEEPKLEPPKEEAKPEPVVEPPKPEEPKKATPAQESHWAAERAKQDKRDRALIQKTKQEAAEAKARAAELEAKLQAATKKGVSAKEAPLDYLKEAGLELDDVLRAALNDGKPTPELKQKITEDKVAEAERKAAEVQKRLDEFIANEAKAKKEQARAQQLYAFQREIADHIKASPDDYALLSDLHGENSIQAVFDRIDSHYAATRSEDSDGEILSIKQAADAIEAELLEELAARIPKLLPVLEKRGKYKTTPAVIEPKAPVTPKAPADKPVTTVTNEIAASTAPTTKSFSHRDETDEFEEAVEELKRYHKAAAKK